MLLEAVDPRQERAPREHPAADHEATPIVAPAGGAVTEEAFGRAEQGKKGHGGPGRRNHGGEDRAERSTEKGRRKRVAAASASGRPLERERRGGVGRPPRSGRGRPLRQ